MAKRDKIYIGMATMPERVKAAKQSLESLIKGSLPPDFIDVYMNCYTEEHIEDLRNHIASILPKRPKIEVRLWDSETAIGDIGDAGKFYRAHIGKGFKFSVDDDIRYPENYIEAMIDKLEYYERTVALSIMGRIPFQSPIKSYYKDTAHKYRTFDALEVDTPCTVLGTGGLLYHTDRLTIHVNNFPVPNMADIFFALVAQRDRLPMYTVARPKDWLGNLWDGGRDIYREAVNKDTVQTAVMNSRKWLLHTL